MELSQLSKTTTKITTAEHHGMCCEPGGPSSQLDTTQEFKLKATDSLLENGSPPSADHGPLENVQ